MSDLILRHADLSDLEAVALLFDGYRQFYECEPDLEAARAWIAQNLTEHRSTILVAEQAGELLGFTQLYGALCSVDMKPFYVLYDLFVAPSRRGCGVGRALMDAASEWAREQGAARIDLETAHTNTIGQALYESLGYEHDLVFRKYSLDLSD